MSYQVRGDGEPALFIQGVGLHGDGWRPQVDALAAHARCITFDNRGIGAGPALAGRLTVPQMADDALAVLDALGVHAAHVVGHSLGGLVAQELALRARDRVKSLALLCTFARGRDATALTWRMLWLGMRSRIGPRRARRRAFLQIVMPPSAMAGADTDAMAAELAPLFGHDLADQPPVVMKQLAAMKAWDTTARLGELAGIRTLVVSAAHDPIARPASAHALATGIPGARHVALDDASHGVPIHQPERINALLREHFAVDDRARSH
jgi:pimeloyl-ACP methyl ester carboxylesterase